MAPEVLDGAIQFTRDAFLHIDVYALGLVIWELMTRATGREAPANAEPLPAYMPPFEAELGPLPTMEQLQHCVAKLKKRPQPSPRWENDQVCRLFAQLLVRAALIAFSLVLLLRNPRAWLFTRNQGLG